MSGLMYNGSECVVKIADENLVQPDFVQPWDWNRLLGYQISIPGSTTQESLPKNCLASTADLTILELTLAR